MKATETEGQIAKAKEAKSAEELLALANEYGIEDFTKEDAEDIYKQLHSSGELSDEEMENVAGGCSTKVDGQKYTVVNCSTDCFTGKWQQNGNGNPERTDHKSLRSTWAWFGEDYSETPPKVCGNCYHLGFKAGTGYCKVQFD